LAPIFRVDFGADPWTVCHRHKSQHFINSSQWHTGFHTSTNIAAHLPSAHSCISMLWLYVRCVVFSSILQQSAMLYVFDSLQKKWCSWS